MEYKCKIKIDFPGNAEDHYRRFKKYIDRHNEMITGDTRFGFFNLPVPGFGTVTGLYSVSGQTLTIYILKKSFLLPCYTIENFLKKVIAENLSSPRAPEVPHPGVPRPMMNEKDRPGISNAMHKIVLAIKKAIKKEDYNMTNSKKTSQEAEKLVKVLAAAVDDASEHPEKAPEVIKHLDAVMDHVKQNPEDSGKLVKDIASAIKGSSSPEKKKTPSIEDILEAATHSSTKGQPVDIIKRYMWWAMGAGLLPWPLVDDGALVLVQMRMVDRLSEFYGRTFSENDGKALITSLLGAITADTLSRGGFISIVKSIPVVGIVGLAAMPIFSGAVTYVIGTLFSLQMASDNDLLEFKDIPKKYYGRLFKIGQQQAKNMLFP